MSELVERAVGLHVARSLDDLRDGQPPEQWLNGERARDEARAIADWVLDEVLKRLEQEKRNG